MATSPKSTYVTINIISFVFGSDMGRHFENYYIENYMCYVFSMDIFVFYRLSASL